MRFSSRPMRDQDGNRLLVRPVGCGASVNDSDRVHRKVVADRGPAATAGANERKGGTEEVWDWLLHSSLLTSAATRLLQLNTLNPTW